MATLQFSLRTLFALVALAAVACVALPNATRLWATSIFSLALAVLVVATFLAAFRRGAARAYWAGFCAVGWFYLLLVFGPVLREPLGQALITGLLLDELREWVQQPSTDTSGMTEDEFSYVVNDVRHYVGFSSAAQSLQPRWPFDSGAFCSPCWVDFWAGGSINVRLTRNE